MAAASTAVAAAQLYCCAQDAEEVWRRSLFSVPLPLLALHSVQVSLWEMSSFPFSCASSRSLSSSFSFPDSLLAMRVRERERAEAWGGKKRKRKEDRKRKEKQAKVITNLMLSVPVPFCQQNLSPFFSAIPAHLLNDFILRCFLSFLSSVPS